VPGRVVVHRPGIQHDDAVLRDELALVCEVFASDVRGTEPERVVAAFNLFIGCELS
jgi:hypothetical protein